MKLVSWNVNGIRAVHKKGLFVPFVEKLPEYEEYWNSAAKKGYSGTAIFSKVKPISVILGMPEDLREKYRMSDDTYGDPNTEGRVITAEYDELYVSTVYTPNAKDDLSRIPLRHKLWDPAFLAYMKRLEEDKPVVFCGDLNVAHTPDDLANDKQNEGKKGYTEEEREGIDHLVDAGFVDTFRMFTKGKGHYTWWSHFSAARERNIGWRIDYFFVSKSLVPHVKRARIHADIFGSDHCPISLELDL
jgi:exodeoxyribonuclease III